MVETAASAATDSPTQGAGDAARRFRFCQMRTAFWGGVVTYVVLEATGLCGRLHELTAASSGVFRALLFAAVFGVLFAGVGFYNRRRRRRRIPVAASRADMTARREALIAHLNHEIRTPLNAVTGFAGLIAGTPAESLDVGRCQEYARRILDAGMELERLAENLVAQLASARDDGDAPAQPGFNVAALLGEVRSVLSPVAQARARRLRISLRPGLEHAHLAGSREQLFGLMGNLVQLLLQGCAPGEEVRIVALEPRADGRIALRFVLPDREEAIRHVQRLADALDGLAGGHAWRASRADPLVKLLATRLDLADAELEIEEDPDGDGINLTLLLPCAQDRSPAAAADGGDDAGERGLAALAI